MNLESIERVVRKMALEEGLINVTRDEVRRRMDADEGSFAKALGSMSFTDVINTMDDVPVGEPDGSRRANPALRRASILASAVALACEESYLHLTRDEVADAAQVSPASVTMYFGSMDGLRAEIMEVAVVKDIPRIIAQGLLAGDSIAMSASDALKRRAGKYTANL